MVKLDLGEILIKKYLSIFRTSIKSILFCFRKNILSYVKYTAWIILEVSIVFSSLVSIYMIYGYQLLIIS